MMSIIRRVLYSFLFLHLLVDAANTTQCNGYDSLCSRLYSNVTFLGAHNSYAVGSSISDNQNYDVTTQLNDGIRLLQGQGHNGTNKDGSMIQLCHSSCALQNGGTLEAYLGKVKEWVAAHPREVITILWVNSDNMPASYWAKAYMSSGLSALSYAPSSLNVKVWPTLQTLISAGTPVVNFLTSKTDTSIPYLLPEWDNMWETPYDNTDNTFDCEFDRGTRPNQLYLANHFAYKTQKILGASIDSPDTSIIDATNSVANMQAHASLCASTNSRYPNFFLVDYYDKASGGALEAVAHFNNVQYVAKTLGDGAKKSVASAFKSFFGGQNEIRNIAIVSAAGALVLILLWVACCCWCRRKRRRSNSMAEEAHKPLSSNAAPFASSFEESKSSFVERMTAPQQTKYAPVSETHEMPLYARNSSSHSGFSDFQDRARPLPTPPRYTGYNDYRSHSPSRHAYRPPNPWDNQ